ncbi:6-phospho-beta-glucosidase, partial [bacterium]|nr:6-phospho-beta-glucosidase [bacterium]
LNTLGLNHLTWHRGFTLDGEDVWNQVLKRYLEELRSSAAPEFDPAMVESLKMVPNYYLAYYYHTERKLEEQKKWPPSRAEQVMEVEKNLLRQYDNPALTTVPADLMKRGGAYYSTVATQLLKAHFNDLGETHVVNTRQGCAIPGYPSDWVMEMPCRIDRNGAHPLPTEPLSNAVFNLMAQVKSFEMLAVEAAVHGDRKLLYQALQTHPLGPKSGNIQAVMDDLLETNRAYVPLFWQ